MSEERTITVKDKWFVYDEDDIKTILNCTDSNFITEYNILKRHAGLSHLVVQLPDKTDHEV